MGLRTPNLGEEEAIGVGDGNVRKNVDRPSKLIFPLSLRISDIATVVLQHATFCPPHL